MPERLEDAAVRRAGPQIPIHINFSGDADRCMSHEAGFTQIGSFDQVDKKTGQEFADSYASQKKGAPKDVAEGARMQ